MRELFGIPVGSLALVLAVALAASLGVVVVLALRNRVFVRLGLRNVRRRPGRSTLIVAGLMLGTAIIAAALATGDTMSTTIRSTAIEALGETDEVVSVAGADVDPAVETEGQVQVRYFPEPHFDRIAEALEGNPQVDGVAPAIIESVAVQDVTSRQNEPRVTLFASEASALDGWSPMEAPDGRVTLAELAPGEVYLNDEASEELGAGPGDEIRVLAGESVADARVRAVVMWNGAGTDGPAVLTGLDAAQALLGQSGQIKHVLVSNAGDAEGGAKLSDEVVATLGPVLSPLGLDAEPVKKDLLEEADELGAGFMSIFTTFGSFSIAAGFLLIFLIFVMLAAERRGELGIARAVGTRRGHLVQMFLFEGFGYDLLAAAVGALVGIAVAYGMVILMAGALAATGDLEISYSVSPRSVVIAYAAGVLLTFVVVSFSAWRVSRMNIVTAIRNLPEPPARKRGRARWILGLVGLALGGLVLVSGYGAKDEITFGLGASLIVFSLLPLARAAGVGDRAARTAAGLALVLWFLLPTSDWFLGDEAKTNFSVFLLGGLMIVVGATWVIMYNADLLLGALARTLGRVRALAPVLKLAMAYPLRSLFRTGVTLAMFTLVVFTLVVGGTISGAFANALDDVESFGGGFDVRASASPASPIVDMDAALEESGLDPNRFDVVASQSLLPVEAEQVGGAPSESYAVRGFDDAFLEHTTYGLATLGAGYDSPEEVWEALRTEPGLAVVDQWVVPRRANYSFGGAPDFQLEGFFIEDQGFEPVVVEVTDPQTSRQTRLTVIGVLSDAAPLDLGGILTSQETLADAFGERARPTGYFFALRDPATAERTAQELETAFVANGLEAEAMSEVLEDAVGANLTFNRIVQGFMGLGLIVGVAALGVISARSVVERRQQIGVLRAIGFRRGMVQLSFLLESSFIALTSILVGTFLGLLVAWNVIRETQSQPSWDNLSFDVPWGNLTLIFFLVYVVALATTFAPALRASRVYPAEALRYQ